MRIYKCLLFVLFVFLFQPKVSAQDSEIKDEITIIKVYIRLSYQDSSCVICADELRKKLESIKGIWSIKILPVKQVVTFYMYSNQVMAEKKLKRMLKEAGFITHKIEYSKEEPEIEKDDELFL